MLKTYSGLLSISIVLSMRLDLSVEKHLILEDQYEGTNITKATFTQLVDHFDVLNNNTWSQEYFVDTTHWKGPGYPIFIYIGGEGDVESRSFDWPWCREYAAEFNALCFVLEHRFYGQSQPFGFKNQTKCEKKLLTASQALADASVFITEMNRLYDSKPDLKWLAFGCSYAGTLATWLRLKYPDLVHGAIASSAPLLAQLHYPEYFQHLEKSFYDQHPECLSAIKAAEHDYQESKDLLCQKIDTCYNKNFNVLGWVLKVETMQYHDFRNSNWNYHLICKYMTDPSSGDHFHRFVELWKHKSMKNQKYISWSDERAWNYQKCHEFGWFKTHSGIRTLKSAIEDSCDQFSDKFEENVIEENIAQTNFLFGGKELNVSNVVFLHGSLDPWSVMGRTEPWPNEDVDVMVIEGASHCQDYWGNHDNWPQMKLAKSKIRQRLQEWKNSDF